MNPNHGYMNRRVTAVAGCGVNCEHGRQQGVHREAVGVYREAVGVYPNGFESTAFQAAVVSRFIIVKF